MPCASSGWRGAHDLRKHIYFILFQKVLKVARAFDFEGIFALIPARSLKVIVSGSTHLCSYGSGILYSDIDRRNYDCMRLTMVWIAVVNRG